MTEPKQQGHSPESRSTDVPLARRGFLGGVLASGAVAASAAASLATSSAHAAESAKPSALPLQQKALRLKPASPPILATVKACQVQTLWWT